jgi:hypothetical protein
MVNVYVKDAAKLLKNKIFMKKFKFILTNLFAFTTVITPISLFTTSCYRFDPSKGDYMMMNINHWNSEY